MGDRSKFFAMKVKITFDDKVDPSGTVEHGKTKVVVYLDSTVNAIHYWEKDDVKHGDTVIADLCGHIAVSSSGVSFPPECRLCFQIFKRMNNEFGKKCWLDFGAANVPLVQIIKHQRASSSSSSSSPSGTERWFDVPLKMHTVSTNTMGILKVRIVDIDNDNDVRHHRLVSQGAQLAPSSSSSSIENNIESSFSFSENSVFITADPFTLNYDDFVHNDPSTVKFRIASKNTTLSPSQTTTATATTSIKERSVLTLDSVSACFDGGISEPVSNTIARAFNVSSTSFMKKLSSPSVANKRNKGLGKLIFEKRQLELYFKEYNRENAYFRDWISGADNINCPFYPSQVTLMDTQIFLPYVAYVLYEPSLISPKFWMDALKIASSRRRFGTVEEYCDHFFDENTMTLERRAVHAMDMICQLAHTMEYIADQVIDPVTKETRKIEIFGDALFTFDGDCDDLASVVFQMFDDFSLRQAFAIDASRDSPIEQKIKRVLIFMQDILKRYVPFMCIEGVTSASAQNQHDIEKTEITGAHAAVKCLPIWYVKRCVANWNPNHPIVTTPLSYDVNVSHVPGGPFNYTPFVKALENAGERDDGDNDVKGWEKDLPILIGEGTGMLNSGGEPDPCTKPGFRKFVYSCKATKCSKKHLYPPKGTSPFYKAVLFASTNRFINDFKIGTFRFCQKNPKTSFSISQEPKDGTDDNGGEFCRGVLFSDLIAMKDDVVLIPYGDARDLIKKATKKKKNNRDTKKTTEDKEYLMIVPAPNETGTETESELDVRRSYFEFSDTQLHIMKETLKTRLKPKPIVSLEPFFNETNVVVDFGSRSSVQSLDAVVRTKIERSIGFRNLCKLKARLESNVASNWGLNNESEEGRERAEISIYYDDGYVTESTCDDLYDHFKRENVVLHFCMENHSSTVWQWRLTFKGLFSS